MDIHNKDFKRGFRGYDEDDVDDFLDRIVNDYSQVIRERDKYKTDLERVRKDNAQYQKLEKNLKDTLMVAQKTADEVTTNARENAEQQLKNAAKECQNMRQEAELRAKATVDAAEEKVRVLTQEYNHLLQEKKRFLQKIQYMMAQELSGVEATIDNLPNEIHETAEKDAKPAEKKPAAMPNVKVQAVKPQAPMAAMQQQAATKADKPQQGEQANNGRVVEKGIRI